jgi:hypothetical protein
MSAKTKLLTTTAVIICDHGSGRVIIANLVQHFVSINGNKVLVEGDPVLNPKIAGSTPKVIVGCSNIGTTIKPCLLTLTLEPKGLSDFIKIDGKKVCLETVTGVTDGTPPSAVKYKVCTRRGIQTLVTEVKG